MPCLALLTLSAAAAAASKPADYLTKTGDLTGTLTITRPERAVLGVVVRKIVIEPSGAWRVYKVVGKWEELERSGTLHRAQREALVKELARFDLLGLKDANRFIPLGQVVYITFGGRKAELWLREGEFLPRANTGDRPGRFAGIAEAIDTAVREPVRVAQLPYRELTGRAEGFRFVRQWRSYYWSEDFTFLLRTDAGQLVRIISREPTPWNDLRLGTTFTGLKVPWDDRPRVRVIGVQGIDRTPAEFPGVNPYPTSTVTALIVRVETGGKMEWRDWFVNNWFHPWGKDADRKMLAHHANSDANYTIYGFLSGAPAPFDSPGKALVEKYGKEYCDIVYHARVVRAKEGGFELRVLHLMGRHRKWLEYRVLHGDPRELVKLDQKPPKKK
jgi:hypothetical protein